MKTDGSSSEIEKNIADTIETEFIWDYSNESVEENIDIMFKFAMI